MEWKAALGEKDQEDVNLHSGGRKHAQALHASNLQTAPPFTQAQPRYLWACCCLV